MFEKIKDENLLLDCKLAVQTEKQSTARVLEYLAEIDKRRLWLREGFSSLYDFCIRFLNYSEGETHRRIQACRLSARVEEVKPLLEQRELSLTAMSLLSPVLNAENAKDILPKVTHQPTREVERIIREHFPQIKPKREILKIELDEELVSLLEAAKEVASVKDPKELLKRVLRNFVRERKPRRSEVKRHTRYVPQRIAREVKARDGSQCTFISHKGVRCNQRAHLQIDHVRPFAKGGTSHDASNLRVLCRAHNLHLAKIDFPHFGGNGRSPSENPLDRKDRSFYRPSFR